MITDKITDTEWTTVVTAGKGNLLQEWKEMLSYRGLIWMLVKRDWKTMYAQTILGPLWIVITAILSSSVLTLVFGKVADLSTDGVPQFLFYMAGNILWIDFSACISKLSGTFLSHANLMGKVYFPRICVPIAGIISRQIQFLIQFFVFLCVWFYYRKDLEFWQMSSKMFFIPVLFLELLLLAFGCGLILTSITVKYRDFSVLVSFVIQIWMYLSSVVYPVSQVPVKLRTLFLCNPVAPVLETWRVIWFGTGNIPWRALALSMIVTMIVLGIGLSVFQKTQRAFADRI